MLGNPLDAATRGVLCKTVFLETSQNSQENTCARVCVLIKLQALGFFTEHLWKTVSDPLIKFEVKSAFGKLLLKKLQIC